MLTQTLTWLQDDLGCPLIKRSAEVGSIELEEDCDSLFDCDDSRMKLQPLLIPGNDRLHVFEWLLTRFDPLIIDSVKHADSIQEKMAVALRELGIANYTDKKAGIQNDLTKSIMGMNGLNDSIQLLYRLTSLVVNSA